MKKYGNYKGEENIRFILGAVLIFNECIYYWRLLYVGNGGSGDQLITYIPLQVCEWSAFIVAFMLLKKSKHLYDIAFYACLSLGVIPLITPAVIMTTGPLYARYYQFWLEHLLPIFALFYMTFVHGFKPNYRKIYKPFAFLGVLATLSMIANLTIEGANFKYLAATTDGDSIANFLPPNVWLRLLIGLGLVSVLFAIISLPQIIKEIKEKRKKQGLKN